MSGTRRRFLAGASLALPPSLAQTGANDRIRLGLIGNGGRGNALFAEVAKSGENAAITAVCDVWRVNRDAMAAKVKQTFGSAPWETTRYQELLARKDVDAVLIATPDMTHPKILADAVAAGKDVYVEKPFAVDFNDAKMAYLAVKKTDRVVQVGTQRRSEAGLIGVARAIQGGAIGKVTRVNMEVNFQEARWRRDHHMVKAEDVDWEAFRFGGRISGGFDARKLREWQLFRETTNGIAGLWMCHYIDLPAWFLNDPFPRRVVALGGVYLWKDGRQTSDVFEAICEYKDCLVTFAMSLTNASGGRNHWFGTKGTINADTFEMSGDVSRDPNRLEGATTIEKIEVDSHMANFLKCMRTRQQPRATVEAGYSHAVAGCMAATALETGRRVGYDPARMELT